MKKLKKIIPGIVLFLAFVFMMPAQADAAVKISSKAVTLTEGQSVQLKITGTNKKVKWKSSKESVATVTSKGKVTGIKAGKCKVTATVLRKKYSCTVTVKKKAVANPNEEALKQYRGIIKYAKYYFSSDGLPPTGTYHYALVRMNPKDTVQTLLLEQDTVSGISNVKVFQYNPKNGTMIEPSGTLQEGMSSAGGYRGDLAMQRDGNGIQETSISSGTGATVIYRVVLSGGALRKYKQWSGRMDQIPASMTGIKIAWHDFRN